jgi:hypothetical protein
MINKMICIKESDGLSLPHYSVIYGEIYSCKESKRYDDCYEVSVTDDEDDGRTMLYIGLFYKKLFLTQAEWRDKQINSILDDE